VSSVVFFPQKKRLFRLIKYLFLALSVPAHEISSFIQIILLILKIIRSRILFEKNCSFLKTRKNQKINR